MTLASILVFCNNYTSKSFSIYRFYLYYLNGTYKSETWRPDNVLSYYGITSNDDYIWVTRADVASPYTQRVKQYNWDKEEIFNFPLNAANANPRAMEIYNKSIYVGDSTDNLVYQYNYTGTLLANHSIEADFRDFAKYGNIFAVTNGSLVINLYNSTWDIVDTLPLNSTLQDDEDEWGIAQCNQTFYVNERYEYAYPFLITEDKTNNESISITNYYSDWDYDFPEYIDYLEFIPNNPTSKNVTPYGQTDSRPILNISNTGYGGMQSNFSTYLSETHGCVNLTMSTTENKSDGFILNNTWIDLFTNFDYLEFNNLWMWADYECNYSVWQFWEPDLSFRNCCEDCVCSEEL